MEVIYTYIDDRCKVKYYVLYDHRTRNDGWGDLIIATLNEECHFYVVHSSIKLSDSVPYFIRIVAFLLYTCCHINIYTLVLSDIGSLVKEISRLSLCSFSLIIFRHMRRGSVSSSGPMFMTSGILTLQSSWRDM